VDRPRPTLKDVAREAGVDVSTASRVLRRTSDAATSHETRQRIEDAAARLQYQPNILARGLRLKRTGSIGVVIPQLDNPVFQELVLAVEEEAAANGQSVIIYHIDERHRPAQSLVSLALANQVDGLIVATLNVADSGLDSLHELPCPFILVNRAAAGVEASVSLDDAAGARLAVRHLANLGHRRIGFLGGPAGRYNADQRLAGFRAGLAEADLDFDPALVATAGYDFVSGRAAMKRLIEAGGRPEAIVGVTLTTAVGVIAAAAEAGIEVPRDLSVVAVHDGVLAEMCRPRLTTVRFPVDRMARTAVRALRAQIEGDGFELPVVLPPEGVVVRDSCASRG
jgi:LacI family transcriptional regulator